MKRFWLPAALAFALSLFSIFLLKHFLYPDQYVTDSTGFSTLASEIPEQCWRSIEQRKSINEAIDEARTCKSNDQCLLVNLGCPFSCSQPININSVAQIEIMTGSFHDYAHEKQCSQCRHKCIGYESVVCENSKCVGIEYVPKEDPKEFYCPAEFCQEKHKDESGYNERMGNSKESSH